MMPDNHAHADTRSPWTDAFRAGSGSWAAAGCATAAQAPMRLRSQRLTPCTRQVVSTTRRILGPVGRFSFRPISNRQ